MLLAKEICRHAARGDVLIDDWEKFRQLWLEAGGHCPTHPRQRGRDGSGAGEERPLTGPLFFSPRRGAPGSVGTGDRLPTFGFHTTEGRHWSRSRRALQATSRPSYTRAQKASAKSLLAFSFWPNTGIVRTRPTANLPYNQVSFYRLRKSSIPISARCRIEAKLPPTKTAMT